MPPTTRLSDKAFYERMASDALRDGQPMDAGFVWKLVDNVQHLVDESGCYRVNWNAVGSDNGGAVMLPYGAVSGDGDAASVYWYTLFPTQLVLPDQYPRFEIRMQVSLNLLPIHPIRVSLVIPTVQPPVTGLTRGVLGTYTSNTQFSGYIWDQFTVSPRKISDAPIHLLHAPSPDGSEAAVGDMVWLKLLFESGPLNMEEDPPIYITGLSVREYLR